MNRYDLDRELGRTRARPDEEPIALLGLLTVTPALPKEQYARRLRELVASALEIARVADFDEGDVPLRPLPGWFLELTDGEPDGGSPDHSGKRNYLTSREGAAPWDVEEWVYCFDPGLRAWSWWDLTDDGRGGLAVWVDTKGEAHIPCEELWWAVYAAGADAVEPLVLEDATRWQGQRSVGVGG